MAVGSAQGSEVRAVRLGVHADHTRLVLDLSAPTQFTVTDESANSLVIIQLADSAAAPKLQAALAGQGLVQAIDLEPRGKALEIRVALSPGARLQRYDTLVAAGSSPARVFMDIVQREGAAPVVSQPVVAGAVSESAEVATKAGTAAAKPEPVQLASAATTLQTMRDLVAAALKAGEAEAAAAAAKADTAAGTDETAPLIPPSKPDAPGTAAAENTAPAAAAESGDGVMLAAMLIPPTKPKSASGKFLIALDAGHGGKDPGATGINGTEEKEITLKMALELKALLEGTGRYDVLLVREDDTLIPLRKRIEIARQSGADLFISLHADHNDNKHQRGASVYTLSETASDAEAAALATRENKEDLITGVDLSHQSQMVTSILIDLAQRETKNLSARFASYVTKQLSTTTRMVYSSHRFAGFAVLKSPDVPSILVELGYLSNELDEKELVSKRYRGRMAKAILRAIDQYVAWQKGEKAS
ncbi:MAG TPA: N-acetylmuramoyl-L-alanine amidase [Dongiaceae bacterium]